MKVIELAEALLRRKQLREGQEYTNDRVQELQALHKQFEAIENQIKTVVKDTHSSLEVLNSDVRMLSSTLGDLANDVNGYDVHYAIKDAIESLNNASSNVIGIETALKDTLKSLYNAIEDEKDGLEYEARYGATEELK